MGKTHKKSKMYIGICSVYATILLVNTVILVLGFGVINLPETDHATSRLVFMILRGIAVLGTDLFAIFAIYQTSGSRYWIAFGFTTISLVLSIVNSALDPSILSRIDLDFDILCFLVLLILIREVYQLKKQSTREILTTVQAA